MSRPEPKPDAEPFSQLEDLLGGNLPDQLFGSGINHLDHSLPAIVVNAELELPFYLLGKLVQVFDDLLDGLLVNGL